MNPHIPRGSGKLTFLGVTPATGDISILMDGEAKAVPTSQYGALSAHYQGGATFTITCPPVANIAELLPLYAHIGAVQLGQALAPHRLTVSALNLGTEVITTAVAHGLTTADAVHVARGDGLWPVLSAGTLSEGTIYYARALTTTTLSLHTSGADATANTNPLNFTAWLESTHGPFYICRDLPCVVHFADGGVFTFGNVAIESLPVIECAGTSLTVSGNLVLRAFLGTGKSSADSDGYYVKTRAAYTPPDNVSAVTLTSPATGAWGTWTGMTSETSWKITIAPTLTDIVTSQHGVVSKLLTGVTVTITGKPQNITTADLETALAIRGGSGVGGIMGGDEFIITGSDGLIFTVADMMLDKGTVMASLTQQRIGELTWTLTNPTPGPWFSAIID